VRLIEEPAAHRQIFELGPGEAFLAPRDLHIRAAPWEGSEVLQAPLEKGSVEGGIVRDDERQPLISLPALELILIASSLARRQVIELSVRWRIGYELENVRRQPEF